MCLVQAKRIGRQGAGGGPRLGASALRLASDEALSFQVVSLEAFYWS